MQLTILAGDIGSATSGQSRFGVNLARGLRARGHDVTICAASCRPEAERALGNARITVRSLGLDTDTARYKARLVTAGSKIGRRVATLALTGPPSDWYIVLSDTVVSASRYLPGGNSVLVANGDLALMFLSRSFYAQASWAKRILSRGAARVVLQNGENVRRYRLRVGNSEFTRQFLSYLYATPFEGVVYPPVDTELFHWPGGEAKEPYVLVVARNEQEQGLDRLAELARHVPLKIVGGARVPGANSLGVVEDEALARAYGEARFVISNVVSEFFGYPVAESFACSTPVLAFDAAGPSELIRTGENGWLVRSERQLVPRAMELFSQGVPASMRAAARASSGRFSIASSALSMEMLLTGSGV